MPTTLVNDTPIQYALDGAPVLLLSHGLGLAFGMWSAQMATLLTRFRVLRYEMRGHGMSSIPAESSSMDDLGHDFVALLDHLHNDGAHFCGCRSVA